jgi:hypothetical protein
MIAVAIIMLVLATLAFVVTRAFAAVAKGSFSQEAAELADSVIAQEEALPWGTLGEGLSTNDPGFTADGGSTGNISAGTTGYCFEGMPLVANGSSGTGCSTTGAWANPALSSSCTSSIEPTSAGFPLYNTSYLAHQECIQLDGEGAKFEASVYPTATSSSSPLLQEEITVVVSWGTGTDSGQATHVTDSAILGCDATGGLPTNAKCT